MLDSLVYYLTAEGVGDKVAVGTGAMVGPAGESEQARVNPGVGSEQKKTIVIFAQTRRRWRASSDSSGRSGNTSRSTNLLLH